MLYYRILVCISRHYLDVSAAESSGDGGGVEAVVDNDNDDDDGGDGVDDMVVGMLLMMRMGMKEIFWYWEVLCFLACRVSVSKCVYGNG